jgi:hypothetical protein
MMPSRLRIAIITYSIDVFQDSSYLLHLMCEVWQATDMEIVIIKGPQQDLPEADLAILHTDITAIGDDYGRVIDHYPMVINGRVRDISKHVFSDLIVDRNCAYTGPVIVKTNANFGGMRERQEKHLGGDHQAGIDIQRPWRKVEWLEEYPTFNSPGEVPTGVWRNDKLVVERFLTQRNESGEYLLQVWVFFGDQEIYYQCVSDEPVIKSHNTKRREFLDPNDLPDSLRETRTKLGFDFGKFDFSIIDGEVVLYDVNRTPGSAGNASDKVEVSDKIRRLSTGLHYFTEQL